MDGSKSDISTEPEMLSTLRVENSKLNLQKENAQLVADIRRLSSPDPPALPWWKSGATITTLTTIIAAIVPLTAAVQGWVQKNREIALEESKQSNAIAMQREKQTEEIRTGYLERTRDPADRLRTLRFVLATTSDRRLEKWALGELQPATDDVGKLLAAVDAALKAREKQIAHKGVQMRDLFDDFDEVTGPAKDKKTSKKDDH